MLGTMSPKSIVVDADPDSTRYVFDNPLPDELTMLQPMQVAAALLFPLLSGQVVLDVKVPFANQAYGERLTIPEPV